MRWGDDYGIVSLRVFNGTVHSLSVFVSRRLPDALVRDQCGRACSYVVHVVLPRAMLIVTV
jgi:hypothetical protein